MVRERMGRITGSTVDMLREGFDDFFTGRVERIGGCRRHDGIVIIDGLRTNCVYYSRRRYTVGSKVKPLVAEMLC